MIDIWSVIRWAHLLAAIAWIGGMLFILIVLLPVMRRSMPPAERTVLVAQVGERYGVLSWVALSILVITGVFNGERRGVAWLHLLDGEYGRTLALKLLLVAIVIPITLVHAFYYGRRITRLAEQAKEYGDDPALAAERRRLQRMSGMLSAANLLLNLVIVLLAAALVS